MYVKLLADDPRPPSVADRPWPEVASLLTELNRLFSAWFRTNAVRDQEAFLVFSQANFRTHEVKIKVGENKQVWLTAEADGVDLPISVDHRGHAFATVEDGVHRLRRLHVSKAHKQKTKRPGIGGH